MAKRKSTSKRSTRSKRSGGRGFVSPFGARPVQRDPVKEFFGKVGNEFTNPKSVLRQQFYQDGPIRTKGLDILNKVATGAKVAGMAVPFLAPLAGAINTVNTGAQFADKAARMAGFGRRKRTKKGKKGSGKKRIRKHKK
jgi:hypothetical protein